MCYDIYIFVNWNWVVTRWQYTFTNEQYIEQYKTNNTYNNTTILEECGPCPVLASITLVFALQPRKKHAKTSVKGSNPSNCKRFLSSAKFLDKLWSPPILLLDVQCGLGGKVAGHEADHSPSYSAVVKNDWNCTFTCLICLHACTGTVPLLFLWKGKWLFKHWA